MNRERLASVCLAVVLLILGIWGEVEQAQRLIPYWKEQAFASAPPGESVLGAVLPAARSGMPEYGVLRGILRRTILEDGCTQELLGPDSLRMTVILLHSRTQLRLNRFPLLRLILLSAEGLGCSAFGRIHRWEPSKYNGELTRIVAYIHAGDGKKRISMINIG